MKNKRRDRSQRETGNYKSIGSSRSHLTPEKDADLKFYAGAPNVAAFKEPHLRARWRRVHHALNGGGYHLLKVVRGHVEDCSLAAREYQQFCANRAQTGPLSPFIAIAEATLLWLVNSRKAVSRIVELRSGLAPRSNAEARQTAESLSLHLRRSTTGDVRVGPDDARVYLDLAGIDQARSDAMVLEQFRSLAAAHEAAQARTAASYLEAELEEESVDPEDHESILFVDPNDRTQRRLEQQEQRREAAAQLRSRVAHHLRGARWFDNCSKDDAVSLRWWAVRGPLLDTGGGFTKVARIVDAIHFGAGIRPSSTVLQEKLRSLACPGANVRRGELPLNWFISGRGGDFWRWAEQQFQRAAHVQLTRSASATSGRG